MRSFTSFASCYIALAHILDYALAQSGSNSAGISFPDPTGVSTTYSSTTYNASAATTTLANDDFSDERLAFLWNQVGPVATGPLTETVEPTPEPSTYGSPSGGFHPYIPSYDLNLTAASLPEGFSWGVASSAFQIEVKASLNLTGSLLTNSGRRRRRRQRPINLGLPQPPCRQPSSRQLHCRRCGIALLPFQARLRTLEEFRSAGFQFFDLLATHLSLWQRSC
jgi:hypothetical protein